jgi:glycosyl transferase family 2
MPEPRVTAIVAAYNEADVIGQVVGDLAGQGVSVYLLDDGSTDGTAEAAAAWLGRGLLHVERLPETPGPFRWECILRRKEALARQLDADWFLHHDADEFRESPWPHLRLDAAIGAVEAAGYNAIDFELLNFWPTHDRFQPGDDVRAAFTHYEGAQPWDKVQVRCWKKTEGPVDLVSSGGHEAVFEGRRVFPLRFLLRHYPVRGQAHGERKVFHERRERFAEAERQRGWHRQYDEVAPGARFIRDPATLTAYDAEAVRLRLLVEHRLVEELRQAPAARDRMLQESERAREALSRALDARNREAEGLGRELDLRNHEVDRLGRELDVRNREAERLGRDLDVRNRQADALEGALDERNRALAAAEAERARLQAELGALRASRTWRWSAPLRALGRRVGRG